MLLLQIVAIIALFVGGAWVVEKMWSKDTRLGETHEHN